MANLNDPRVPGEKDGTGTATGVGAVLGGVAGGVAGGAAAGAAVGGMTGPVGAAVGAAVGAVAGALAGRAVNADPVAEDTYWRDNYSGRDYVEAGSTACASLTLRASRTTWRSGNVRPGAPCARAARRACPSATSSHLSAAPGAIWSTIRIAGAPSEPSRPAP